MTILKPIIQIILACFLWGGLFAVPLYLDDFDPFDIVLGRFFFYGVISTALLIFYMVYSKKWSCLKYWKEAALCALIMNIIHYTTLILGMRFVSPSLVTVILGTGPITITIASCLRRDERNLLFSLTIPSLCIFLGIVIMNLELLESGLGNLSALDYMIGITFGLVALATWTWYVIYNAEFLKMNTDIHTREWTALVGVLTFALTLCFILGRYIVLEPGYFLRFHWEYETGKYFLLATFILGFFCSWIAYALWNASSSKLSPALCGQLSILETIFGLAFVYTILGQVPTLLEGLGIAFILVGVSGGLYLSMPERKPYSELTN